MANNQDNTDIIRVFKKNSSQVVCGVLSEYKGRREFHIRIYVPVADEPGEFVPTRKGVTLPIEVVPDLVAAMAKLKQAISLNQVVAQIPKGKRAEVRVGLQEFRGTPMIYVRTFTCDKEGEWRPTQKGVSVKVELLSELVDTTTELEAAAKDRGWLS